MTREVLLDGGGIVAQVAAVGLPVHAHSVGVGDVGFVHRVKLVVIHAAALRHGRESFSRRRRRRRVFSVILHMRQQGPW